MGFQSPGLNLDVSCPNFFQNGRMVDVQIQSLSHENHEQGKFFPLPRRGLREEVRIVKLLM